MTSEGRAYVIGRLSSCATLDALRAVWSSLGREYRQDQAIADFKEDMKARLS